MQLVMFQLGDMMGDYIPKTCSNCRKCTTCTYAGKSISQKERIELEYIERGISHDKVNRIFNVKYPFQSTLEKHRPLTENWTNINWLTSLMRSSKSLSKQSLYVR